MIPPLQRENVHPPQKKKKQFKKEDVIEIVSGLKMCRGLDPVHIEPIKVSQFCYEGVNQLYGNLPCDDTL